MFGKLLKDLLLCATAVQLFVFICLLNQPKEGGRDSSPLLVTARAWGLGADGRTARFHWQASDAVGTLVDSRRVRLSPRDQETCGGEDWELIAPEPIPGTYKLLCTVVSERPQNVADVCLRLASTVPAEPLNHEYLTVDGANPAERWSRFVARTMEPPERQAFEDDWIFIGNSNTDISQEHLQNVRTGSRFAEVPRLLTLAGKGKTYSGKSPFSERTKLYLRFRARLLRDVMPALSGSETRKQQLPALYEWLGDQIGNLAQSDHPVAMHFLLVVSFELRAAGLYDEPQWKTFINSVFDNKNKYKWVGAGLNRTIGLQSMVAAKRDFGAYEESDRYLHWTAAIAGIRSVMEHAARAPRQDQDTGMDAGHLPRKDHAGFVSQLLRTKEGSESDVSGLQDWIVDGFTMYQKNGFIDKDPFIRVLAAEFRAIEGEPKLRIRLAVNVGGEILGTDEDDPEAAAPAKALIIERPLDREPEESIPVCDWTVPQPGARPQFRLAPDWVRIFPSSAADDKSPP